MAVRIVKIAVERKSGELVVKADIVITRYTGTGFREFVMDCRDEFFLIDTICKCFLRCYASDQTCARIRQAIVTMKLTRIVRHQSRL